MLHWAVNLLEAMKWFFFSFLPMLSLRVPFSLYALQFGFSFCLPGFGLQCCVSLKGPLSSNSIMPGSQCVMPAQCHHWLRKCLDKPNICRMWKGKVRAVLYTSWTHGTRFHFSWGQTNTCNCQTWLKHGSWPDRSSLRIPSRLIPSPH